jgi:hypothetical protein
MSSMENLGIRFAEHMGGFFMQSATDPAEGYSRGKTEGHPVDFWVKIHITPVMGFAKNPDVKAEMSGKVTAGPLGSKLVIENGEFNIYPGEEGSGMRHISYRFGFSSEQGDPFFFSGVKNIHINRSEGSRKEGVTLYSRIYRGDSEQGEVYGAGILLFNVLKDGPGLLSSVKATGAKSFSERLMALRALRAL